ncbi:ABC transporter substrate-binding protein [Streptomyces cavernicola]|uniref:ABC transporter substrate-binding protein n=1 Tax=Streptomyces cavernicola TaxID=3043613 RepID=A0ABT6S5D7_9ACTN|nr:ABC transporter substrate-binding protein [Streptomyces sp. B-S-A6]MDI3403309.1 ABC transporter substrate-binding protein [Streptomyces sp. B-S-A6]
MRHSIRLPALAVGLTLVALLTTAGCTDASAEGDGAAAPKAESPTAAMPEVAVDEAAAALLPTDVKTKGTLSVASDASYRPFEYFDTDNKTITGFDIDLTDAVGAKLGLKVRHVNAGFDSILPGLAAKKYDIGASAFSITPERAKTVDFVTYLRGGTGIAVKTGNPLGLKMEPKSLCGHAVSAQKGSVQGLSQLPEISKSCTEAGRKPVAIELFPSQDGANLAVVSGRVDAVMADTISLGIQAEASGGKFELVDGPLYAPDRYGLAVPKNSPLKPALEAAVKAILSDGTVDALMKKWEISEASRIKGGS